MQVLDFTPPERQAQEAVVDLLESLLASAREGAIDQLVVVTMDQEGTLEASASADSALTALGMIAAAQASF